MQSTCPQMTHTIPATLNTHKPAVQALLTVSYISVDLS